MCGGVGVCKEVNELGGGQLEYSTVLFTGRIRRYPINYNYRIFQNFYNLSFFAN